MRRVLVAAALAAALASPADALLCRTKAGALFVRDPCKRKETPVDPATLGGAASPKGDPGPRGASTPRLRAVDAAGTPVGFVNASGDLLFPVAGRILVLDVGTDGVRSGGSLYYEAAGCVGPALVPEPASLVRRASVHAGIAYYPGEPIVPRAILSFRFPTTPANCMDMGDVYDVATGFCCKPAVFDFSAGPAMPVDLNGFVAPFRLEVDR